MNTQAEHWVHLNGLSGVLRGQSYNSVSYNKNVAH